MLARGHRLTDRRAFDQLYRRGQRLSTEHFLVRLEGTGRKELRFGVVMSTKVSKRAVIRNRHKRQIRAVLESLVTHLPRGWDILITVRRAVRERCEWEDFRKELRSLLERRFLV